MLDVEIVPLKGTDRLGLRRMLETWDDFPLDQLLTFGRPVTRDGIFVATHGGDVVGVLSGSYHWDLSESGAFDSFELPPGPHAFLARVHVHKSVRCMSVGRKLVLAFAYTADEYRCTFVGGNLDRRGDMRARWAFFENLGFSYDHNDNFGAQLSKVLSHGWPRP